MARKVPTWTLDEIRDSLAQEVREAENLAAEPQCPSWSPALLDLMRELQALANEDPLDRDKLQEFAIRAQDYAQRLKGAAPIFWPVEDLT